MRHFFAMPFEPIVRFHNRITASPITWGVVGIAGLGIVALGSIQQLNGDNYKRLQEVFGESAVHFTAPFGPPVLNSEARRFSATALNELQGGSILSMKGGIRFSLTRGAKYEDCTTRTLLAERGGITAWAGWVKSCKGRADILTLH